MLNSLFLLALSAQNRVFNSETFQIWEIWNLSIRNKCGTFLFCTTFTSCYQTTYWYASVVSYICYPHQNTTFKTLFERTLQIIKILDLLQTSSCDICWLFKNPGKLNLLSQTLDCPPAQLKHIKQIWLHNNGDPSGH